MVWLAPSLWKSGKNLTGVLTKWIVLYSAILNCVGTDIDGDEVFELTVITNWTAWNNYRPLNWRALYFSVRSRRRCAAPNILYFFDVTCPSRCYVTSISGYPKPQPVTTMAVSCTPVIPPLITISCGCTPLISVLQLQATGYAKAVS